MLEPPEQPTEEPWNQLGLGSCPNCGSVKVVPAVAGWQGARYCLDCRRLVDGVEPT